MSLLNWFCMCPANFKPRNIFISAQISLILRFLLFFLWFLLLLFIILLPWKDFSGRLYVILNASYLQLSYFEEKDWIL